jgi:hypothetical protein
MSSIDWRFNQGGRVAIPSGLKEYLGVLGVLDGVGVCTRDQYAKSVLGRC